jgi:hypothetical protein
MKAMLTRRQLVVTLICLVVAIGLAWSFLGDSEPRYRNIPLSQWIELAGAYKLRSSAHWDVLPSFKKLAEVPQVDTLGPEAADAIRQIGTNAIPCLIEWMSLPEHSWKTHLAQVITKLPKAVRPQRMHDWLWKDFKRVAHANNGFIVLGPAANSAIPELVKTAGDPNAHGAVHAVDVLAGLQPPPIGELVLILTRNPSMNAKVRIMEQLSEAASPSVLTLFGFRVQRNPDEAAGVWSEAVPALVLCVKNHDEQVAAWSVATLAKIRRRPELAVPALIAALDDSRYQVRLAAAKALGDFGRDASPATAKLQTLLAKPDIALSQEVERALQKIASTTSDGSPWEVVRTLDGVSMLR